MTSTASAPTPARVELLLVALLTPLLLFPPIGYPLLLFVPLLLPAFWLIAPPPVTPLNGTLLLLLAAVLLSLTATIDIAYATPKVLGVVLGCAVFFASVRSIRDERALAIALDLFALAGGALAAVGAVGTNWIGKVGALQRFTVRLPAVIRGVPGQSEGFQPNAVAGALLLFIPLQLALAITGRHRALRVALLLFTSAVLLLTQSRNAWLSIAIVFAAWAIWQSRGVTRRVVIALVAVAVIGGAVLWAQGRHLLERTVGGGLSLDLAGRLELWSRAISMIEDFPFTGAGMNGFRRVMPVMYPVLLTQPEVDVSHAHNQLLHTGAELGLVGLVAYIALWIGVAAMLVRAWRAGDSRIRWIVSGLGAGFAALFAFGMADAIALGAKVGIVFWLALALAAALYARTADGASA